MSSIPGSGRSPGGGHGDPLQYSCLENPVDRGAWRATVHGLTESWTQLSMHTQSLRTASFNECSAPSAVLPGAGNRPERCEGALFSLNPQGPLTCLGLRWGSLSSRSILLFPQLLPPTRCSQRSASLQKGRRVRARGGSGLVFPVNMKQALPPPHAPRIRPNDKIHPERHC